MFSPVKPAAVRPGGKSKLSRAFAKVFRRRNAFPGKTKDERAPPGAQSLSLDEDEKAQNRAAMEAVLAKLFANISCIKAAYAQLQAAQSPYDAEEIQSADEMVVSELRSLSELKQCFIKRQFDSEPEVSLLAAEIQEQKGMLSSFEVMGKKLESQLKLKESEMVLLREKLEESDKQNRMLEKRLNPSGLLSTMDRLHLSGLNPTHFVTLLRHAVKGIQSHVRLMMDEMEYAHWDLGLAASAIEPGALLVSDHHRRFAFQAFVSREMFDGFCRPDFSLPVESPPDPNKRRRFFFDRFVELKSAKPMEFLSGNPKSGFARFCRVKYLQLTHPKMESSLFGSLHQRNLVNAGEFPETRFFMSFAEMAKWVWLLHCLSFSFEPAAEIFRLRRKCRFSEVYMESVADASPEFDLPEESGLEVGFTVIPGFRIGKTLIRCQVYLSPVSASQPQPRP